MTIPEFFAMNAGKWFSQRTTHHLTSQKSDNTKSEIVIELLAKDALEVQNLCAQANWGGIRVLSKPVSDWSAPKNAPTQDTTSILVSSENSLYCSIGTQVLPPGTVNLGSDEALTITINTDQGTITERIWFASPNLRLRSIVQAADGIQLASFCSEIRMVSS
jgi:phycoerythrin-associated linker protein